MLSGPETRAMLVSVVDLEANGPHKLLIDVCEGIVLIAKLCNGKVPGVPVAFPCGRP